MNFKGYASVFNVIDKHQDVVIKGAFNNAINKRGQSIELLQNHNDEKIVGRITSLKEDDYGLYVEGNIDNDNDDLIYDIENKTISFLSVGYYQKKQNKINNITYIEEADLIEISIVELPANTLAKIIAFD